MKTSTYIKVSIAGIILVLGAFAGINIYVDPLFHYHAPIESLEYPLYDERYMNYGIAKHFEYDSIITGTSMTSNFLTSQWDNYYGTTSVKLPFLGASYKEINDVLIHAFEHKDSIATVMRCLDPTMLIMGKDERVYKEYPDYLYDDKIFNDVNYVLNKDNFFKFTEYVHTFMSQGGKSTSFDTYKNWAGLYQYGKNEVLANFIRREIIEEVAPFTEEDSRHVQENIEANVLGLVRENPDTDFYLFFPPYSILYWDDLVREGQLERRLQAHQMAIEMMLEYDNIKLFTFMDIEEIVCNLDLYKDSLHYGQKVSDGMIDAMALGSNRLTKENYQEYMNFLYEFYGNYDYEAIFSETVDTTSEGV